jgi:LuxR family transcriptional regulator, maltose regulon positive regulatory protein
MSMPILTTKLHIPQSRPNVVLRPRLIEQLNEGLSGGPGFGRKMTLISAPAGFGKTTLVSGWLAACPYPTAWLSLDEGDTELQRFLVYLVAALQTVNQDVGQDMLAALQSPQLPPLEPLLSALLNEISAASHEFILVLDDYHLIDSKTIDQALTFLLEHLPTKMHLVIASREDPALPLSRLRARSQLTELRAMDLRFTSAEAAEFFNQMMALNLSTEDIAALEIHTEGWIAGLQLAALSMQGNQDIAGFIQSFSGTHRFVLDYLLEEVLERQPVNIQRFLLQTSILNRLCGPLCDVILNTISGPSQKTLEYLDHANLFIIALDNERRWYRYHHLFGDLLRQWLSQELTAEEITQNHIRASEWYEANGDRAEAFHHAIAAKDFSRGAALAEVAWQGMNESFQNAAWLGWVKQLPEQLIRTRPVLCTQIAWSLMDAGEVDASESRLQDAERLLNGPAEEMVVVEQAQFRSLAGRIAFARAYNAQSLGKISDTLKYAEQALKLTPVAGEYLRAQTKAILTSAHWAGGNLDAAYNSMHDWMLNSQKVGNYIFAIASAHGLAEILIAQGHLRDALRTYEQSLQLAAEHGREVQGLTAHHHLGLAMLNLEMGNEQIAGQQLQTGLKVGTSCTLADWPYHKSVTQARWKEFEGDLDAALEGFEEAKQVYIRTLMVDAHPVEALKARIYLKQGRLSKAQNWVQEQGLAIDDEISYLHEFDLITLARVLAAEYQSSGVESVIRDVLHLLDRLLDAAQVGQRTGSVIEILIVQALAYDARGHQTKAVEPLRRALALAEPEGYMRIFVDEGSAMAELLAGLNELSGTAKEYIHKLLNALEKKNELHPALPPQPLIDPLSERELEVLRLVAQGLSNDQISKKLFLSVNTVKGHNLRIFGKLQVKSRTEAVARARELGLL